MIELRRKLDQCSDRLETMVLKLNLEGKEEEVAYLEKKMAQPGFWENQAGARKLVSRLTSLTQQIKTVTDLRRRVYESFSELKACEKEESKTNDFQKRVGVLTKKVDGIGKEIDKFELNTFLAGPYDENNAVMSIHAGQGGTEAMDWASMLLRMYTRYAEGKGFTVRLVDETRGEEAGIKSATLMVEGDFAYGHLRSEVGVHRLVRLSPFDADHARHTSFALVEILPQIEEKTEVKIDPRDLELEAFRASGHGGQFVNKTSSAVRIRHKPTGITVTCQAERSQHRNREIAERILYSRLWELSQQKLDKKKKKLKGDYRAASWGNQIRSYVLHPYRLVKDLRTGLETSDTQAVLDGDLDGFIKAWLRKNLTCASMSKKEVGSD